jgi:GT2 family glycosyltransferase/ubiquinone/menaquinone biosynthesis C-methylase UbiE/glycosyltransferase involved in cell wall biosynthesis/peptidoglycan hydrolase CwlO-like protein
MFCESLAEKILAGPRVLYRPGSAHLEAGVDYTGERFIPQETDPFDELAVEHQQRYQSVKNLVRGKVVLDAGSGEGYGAYSLAETAARVVGIDISEEAIDNARATYQRQNLEYRVGSVDALRFEDRSFDVVVSFEVIEHLEEGVQAAFLREARRVLKRSGILVISTPNKAVYSDPTHHHNRFHKKEFYIDEFESFLRQTFPRISLFGQSWAISSILQRPSSRHLENLKPADGALLAPKYVVAVCGTSKLAHSVDLSSIVVDQRGRFERIVTRVVELQEEVEARNSWVWSREQEIERLGSRILELQEEVAAKDSWVTSREQEFESIGARILELQEEVAAKDSWVTSREQEIERLGSRILELQEEVAAKDSWVTSREQEIERLGSRILELQEEVAAKDSWVTSREQEIERLGSRILDLQDEVTRRDSWALSLKQEIESLGQSLAHYKREAAEFEAGLGKAHQHIASLDARIQSQSRTISGLEHLVESLRGKEAELESIKQSDFWKVATSYWRLRDGLLPHGSRRRRLLKAAFRFSKAGMQAMARVLRGESAQPALEAPVAQGSEGSAATDQPGSREEPIHFPHLGKPKVSIVVPVFNQWAHTYRCMKSIQQTMAGMPCEVILADDGSRDMTARAHEILLGVKVLRDGKNRGFLRNCNRAARRARGQYLYFLNSDTELRPGAIQALVALLDRDPTAGLVGSKLVYPDGRLQEAGGIIWADASGWNFGRGQNPDLPAFNYVKEVDYLSGASFMIRKELWDAIGGFDERYAPAYCEDSDLAFEVRKRGFKVVYQPQSVVIHFEGASHGTDVAQSSKAYQVKNTEALKAKWKEELAAQFPNGTNVFQARDRSAGRKTILLIDHYVPQFDRDAGSRTIWSFIEAFHRMGLNVKFLGDNFYPHQPYTDMLQQAGVEVLTGSWFADHWPEWLEENGRFLDYVFLNRPHIAPKYLGPIKAHTKARILYYVHDLHYLRESKLADLTDDNSLKERVARSKRDEQQLMNRMDVIFSCSDREARIIRELCPDAEVFYVPAYSVEVDLVREYNPQERANLLFVGGFSHPPNIDGVLWFVREVWPDVRRGLPGVIFNIAGSNPPPELRALATDDVKVLGFVSDGRLGELYRTSRLAVIPLRYGGGVKGKTVEAMAHGVPVVCTEYGVEGMPGIMEILDPIQVSASLADGIVGLYNDFPRLAGISRQERGYVAHHFNLEKIQESFAQAIVTPAPVLRAESK